MAEGNAAIVDRWAELFNTNVELLVTELYSQDCLFSGMKMSHEKLIKFEKRVLDAAPNRTIRLDRSHEIADGFVAEGALLDPDKGDDWNLPFCAVLTVHDGKIVTDNTYADFSRWPGMG